VIIAAPGKIGDMFTEGESAIKNDAKVTDTRRKGKVGKMLSQESEIKFEELLPSAKPDQLCLRRIERKTI
jgi:hypothetical protein